MSKLFLARPAALVVAAGLAVAGCGEERSGTSGATTPARTQPAASPAAGADSGAAELRATLTGLLKDHAYLTAIAVDTGLQDGLTSKEFKAATSALDDNSEALADTIGGVYGDATRKEFLGLWRDRITLFVDYAKARNGVARTRARRALDAYRNEFGAFVEGANPHLPADAIAADLEPHVESLTQVIDETAAERATVFASLREAASHMPLTAKILSTGIVRQKPDVVSGDPDSRASELRASLTSLLDDHTYLVVIAIAEGLDEGLDSKRFDAATASLDENSQALGDTIGGIYGQEAGEEFLALWRGHIGMFVAYAKGTAAKSRSAKMKALADLDGFRTELGAFLEGANPNLAADAVAKELEPHVEAIAAATRAAAAGSPKLFDRIAEAGSHVPPIAQLLADGITKQFPEKFQR